MTKKELLTRIDEELAGAVVFIFVLLVTKSLVAAIVLGAFAYIVTYTKDEVSEDVTHNTPNTPVVTTKDVKLKHGEVFIAHNTPLQLFKDSIFITALKGFGKSVFLYTIIKEIHEKYTPDVVKIVLIDLKETGYTLLADSPFIVNNTIYTTANGIDVVETIVKQRKQEYLKLSGKYLIDNLAKYHKVKGNDQPNFPVVLCIIDEAQLLDDQDSTNKPNLTKVDAINKISRAYGVLFIMATQRGATYIPRGMLSQFDIRAIGYMTDPTEYKYAGLTDSSKMTRTEGLFAIGSKSDVFNIVQVTNTTAENMEELADTFEKIENKLPSSRLEANVLVMNWMRSFDRKPTLAEIEEYWQCSKPDALIYSKLWSKL